MPGLQTKACHDLPSQRLHMNAMSFGVCQPVACPSLQNLAVGPSRRVIERDHGEQAKLSRAIVPAAFAIRAQSSGTLVDSAPLLQ
jgi:hypothetical protein